MVQIKPMCSNIDSWYEERSFVNVQFENFSVALQDTTRLSSFSFLVGFQVRKKWTTWLSVKFPFQINTFVCLYKYVPWNIWEILILKNYLFIWNSNSSAPPPFYPAILFSRSFFTYAFVSWSFTTIKAQIYFVVCLE